MAGVYLSYPFCSQKCTYCNFASGVLPASLESEYLEALRSEIRSHQWQWTPETVYLGGGTPSRIAPDDLSRLLESIPGRPWSEAALEVAPGGITAEVARAWRDAGITRVSLGVQSFVDRELRQTGRKHNADIVAREMDLLRAAGIPEINIDLIAGLAFQTEASWSASLDQAIRLQPPHVSVYMLEVDEDSRLGLEILSNGSRFGAANIPSEEQTAAFYERAVTTLAAAGIARYEISNFAVPGHESRHNLKYWRLQPYVGFGSDAHGFDGVTRVSNTEDPREYVARLRRGESPNAERVTAIPEEERFFVGLRLTEGIRPVADDWSRYAEPIHRFVDAGLMEQSGDVLRLTRQGVLLSNEVFQEFLSR